MEVFFSCGARAGLSEGEGGGVENFFSRKRFVTAQGTKIGLGPNFSSPLLHFPNFSI